MCPLPTVQVTIRMPVRFLPLYHRAKITACFSQRANTRRFNGSNAEHPHVQLHHQRYIRGQPKSRRGLGIKIRALKYVKRCLLMPPIKWLGDQLRKILAAGPNLNSMNNRTQSICCASDIWARCEDLNRVPSTSEYINRLFCIGRYSTDRSIWRVLVCDECNPHW